jgi:hypothetical protein
MNKTEKDNLLKILRESLGRVIYTQTTHEYCAQDCKEKASTIKWVDVALSALTFGGLIGIIFANDALFKAGSAILATASLALSSYQLNFNPENEASKHTATAKELWYIREKYKNLILDVTNNTLEISTAVSRRDTILEELKLIYKFSSSTNNKAYKRAQKALQVENEQNFTEEELQKLLPNLQE